jgi:DNA-binding MarR family transcriptional regulator
METEAAMDQDLAAITAPRAGSSGGLSQAGLRPLPDPLVTEAAEESLRTIQRARSLAPLYITLLALVRRDGRDLTARQLTSFMTVYLDSHVHTVSSMADVLCVSRPGVTRILDRLAEYDLVAREEDHDDRRRVLIRRTARGIAFLRELEEVARGGA